MKELVAIALLLFLIEPVRSQSTEVLTEKIREMYKNTEDSLSSGKKFKLQRIFDTGIWLLVYHDEYDINLEDVLSKDITLDATTIVYYWGNEIRKVEVHIADYPDGFSYNKLEFYMKAGKIYFSYTEDHRYNYFNSSAPPAEIEENRYYYRDGKLMKHMAKNFTSIQDEPSIRENSAKTPNHEILHTGDYDENLNEGLRQVEFLRLNNYLPFP